MIFDSLTPEQLVRSMEAEAAKAIAELKCLRKDAEQIDARLRFLLSVIHHMKDKTGEQRWD
jgi:ubiquinone biosynthesis protein UbiJ